MIDTRLKLQKATVEALRESGIAGLSARTLAARAGVNQALVFYHFGTMAELVQTAIMASVDDSVAYYRERFSQIASLSELLDVGRELNLRERELGNIAMMAQLMAGAQHDLMLAEAARYAMAAWNKEIEDVVRRVLTGTPMVGLVDAAGLAQAISASFIGLELYEGVDPVGSEAALDVLDTLGHLLEAVNDLGPVATRVFAARLRKTSRR